MSRPFDRRPPHPAPPSRHRLSRTDMQKLADRGVRCSWVEEADGVRSCRSAWRVEARSAWASRGLLRHSRPARRDQARGRGPGASSRVRGLSTGIAPDSGQRAAQGDGNTASTAAAVPVSKPPVPTHCTVPPPSTARSVTVEPIVDAERARQPTHVSVDGQRALPGYGLADGRRHPSVDHVAHGRPHAADRGQSRRSGSRDRRRRGARATGPRSRPASCCRRRNATITTLRARRRRRGARRRGPSRSRAGRRGNSLPVCMG